MKQRSLALGVSLLAAVCHTAPANIGLSFDKRAGSLPTLTLPYATYQATSYNPNGDVCLSLHTDQVPASNLCCRYIPSRTFALPPHRLEIFDGTYIWRPSFFYWIRDRVLRRVFGVPTLELSLNSINTLFKYRLLTPKCQSRAKPAAPATETGVQDGSYGPICIQAPLKGPQLTGPGASSPIGTAANQFLAGIPVPYFANASEGMCNFSHAVRRAVLITAQIVSSWIYTYQPLPWRTHH